MIKKHFTMSEQKAMWVLAELNRLINNGEALFTTLAKGTLFDSFDEMITGHIRENKETDTKEIWRRFRDVVFIRRSNIRPFVVKVVLVSYEKGDSKEIDKYSAFWEAREVTVGQQVFMPYKHGIGEYKKLWCLPSTETLFWQDHYPDFKKIFETKRYDRHEVVLTEKNYIS